MIRIKCRVERRWELELPKWEGVVIITPCQSKIKTGIVRTSKQEALQDAERLAEGIKCGITSEAGEYC